jgi:Fe2+ transport system protein FeoA/Mn-dependent DtxR family transcriptional regulator
LVCLWLATLLYWRWDVRRDRLAAEVVAHRTIEAEDALKVAYALQAEGDIWDDTALVHAMDLPEPMAIGVTEALIAAGWAEKDSYGRRRLTEEGKARARELIRAHRLWERYLIDREGMRLENVHTEADRREHEATVDDLERLDAELGYPAWDPHGHVIPAQGCSVPALRGRSLLKEGKPSSRLRIVCLDDEPAPLLAQLIVLGLKPGADVEVLERTSDHLRLRLGDGIVPLATAAAQHVAVVPVPPLAVPLGELSAGSQARVLDIQGSGKHQRRMLDMGLVPGAEVTVVREAPLGDPVEYRIKGTAISMRRSDASTVLVGEVTDD